ncbi:MAG: ABC-type transport auxiliary lipoprotein family protein [Ramlibacter sp.]
MKTVANYRHPVRTAGSFVCYLLLVGLLSACAGLVDKPVTRTLYDFGPLAPATAVAAARPAGLPAIVLADLDAGGALDGSAVLYRLGYADAYQLRPYAHARWGAPPPQLIRQRLREQLGRDRVVLNLGESAALAREGSVLPRVLRIELEEFSQYFESPAQSVGVMRLRATLLENTIAGEKLLAQRSFSLQRPAPTADATGGVRALIVATDAAAEEIGLWLQQTR